MYSLKSIFTLFILLLAAFSASAQELTGGLILNTEQAYAGYTLFAPNGSTNTYLIDNQGLVVNTWESDYQPGHSVYLLENGNLLRTATLRSRVFQAGGVGGRVEEFDWDGNLVWEFEYASETYQLHHDIEFMPNGHVLMIAWEYLSADEITSLGRNPDLLPVPGGGQGPNQSQDDSVWLDHIIEVDPTTNTIVWEWHLRDHLIQDYDSSKPNFGVVAEHPERVDINFTGQRVHNDWNHVNAIDYNSALDQIVVSVHSFSEIWIIDHSTTSEEAASSTGGRQGKGGDLLYRWGNPIVYDRGSASDQQLFTQHDARWIDPDLATSNILIFNNGDRRLRSYSSVDEITPPVDVDGNYSLETGRAYEPAQAVWTYTATPPNSFYATNISGAQRLPNGNTLICDGPSGTFFEVTSEGAIVWQYVNPIYSQRPDNVANEVFRAERYAIDFAGFAGKTLTPGAPLEVTVEENLRGG